MNITVRCTTCYPMRLGDCPDTLDFAISVTANTEYAYELCDSQGNIYEGETTTNGSGNVSISTSDVPFDAYPGLFNKWAGSFKLTLYDADGDAVPFTVAGTEYTCIAFSFRETVELDNCNNEISCGCLTGGYAFPSDLIGQDGDFYIVENSGVILEKVDGAWTVFFVPSSGSVTGASNGLNLEGTNVEMGGALNEDTTIAAGAFDYKVTSVPEANKTVTDEFSQDLFGLLALTGFAINGKGFRYVLTYDGNGDPESWLFVKVSNDTALSGTYNASIGYINLATAAECFYEVTTAGLRAVTYDAAANETGLHINRVTEAIDILVNGVTTGIIDSTGWTIVPLAGVGTRMVTASATGLLGTAALPPANQQTGAICITIETVADQDYVIFLKLPYAITITETTSKCVSGTATGTFKINSTALGGTANSISSVEQSQAHASNNAASANDDIVVTISANASCLMASLTVKYTYNLA